MMNQERSIQVKLSSGIMDELMDRSYASPYDPFRELIANSYDAGALTVWVHGAAKEFVVEDDGCGIGDFNSFLTKGVSAKRIVATEGTRPPIGEKGLGFLSVFKIAREVDVYSRHDSETWHVRLTGALVRTSIDSGEPIHVENVHDFLAKRGSRVYLHGCEERRISAPKLYDYACATFAPLLAGGGFRIFVNGKGASPPKLPEGAAYECKGRDYEIHLVDPQRVEDRVPVRFYNKGVLVKREIIARRPAFTGYVNTMGLALVTGRGAYVEDEEYQKFRTALDLFVEQIPEATHDNQCGSDAAVSKSLDRLADVLGKALVSSSIKGQLPLPAGRTYAVRAGTHHPDGEDNRRKVIKLIARAHPFGTSIREAALSPSDFPVMITEDSIVLNVSHPHVSRIASLPEKFRDLALMPFVAEGFVEFLGVKSREEHREMVDKIIREMLPRLGV